MNSRQVAVHFIKQIFAFFNFHTMEYTANEYAGMIGVLGNCTGNFNAAARLYSTRFPNRRHPSYSVIRDADRRLRETGNINPAPDMNRGRPRLREPNLEENVLNMITENPQTSIRSISRNTGASKSVVHRIVKEDGLHPYHKTRVQNLLEEDYPHRVAFCEWLLDKHRRNPNFISNVLWTDEATFTRNGIFNYHNEHFWAHENPHMVHESNYQVRFSVNVWAGIIGDQLVGPCVIPERLNADNYLEFLNANLPGLLEDIPLLVRRDMWVQIDGAPSH